MFNTVKSQRAGLELSLNDIAKHCGVSRQTAYNWETGKTIPDVKYLNKLSEVLKVELGILVTYFTNRSK